VSGYSKLAYHHADLVVAVANNIVEQLSELTDVQLNTLLHAYATLNVSAPLMFGALVKELKSRLEGAVQLTSQQLANLLWSCAVSDVLDRPLYDAITSQIVAEQLSPERLNQVFQALMLCVARYPEQEWPIEMNLYEAAEKSWKKLVRKVIISKFHSEVSRTLNAMGIRHVVEHLTDDGLFSSRFYLLFTFKFSAFENSFLFFCFSAACCSLE
jgi:hypothetical protein